MSSRIDLLARDPDRRIEQIGHLTPLAKDEWGQFDLGGWSPRTVPAQGAFPASAAISQESARLLLVATEPVDRDLELTAWIPAPDPASPGTINASLNGQDLEAPLTLGDQPATHRIHAPAAFWVQGQNVLEIHAVPFRSSKTGQATFDPIHVSEIRYGPVFAIGEHEGRPELNTGTGLSYDLEPEGSPRLRIRGRATGKGELELRYLTVDPVTGLPDQASLLPHTIPLPSGTLDLDLAVQRRGERILRLEVLWHELEAGATLQLNELALEECDPTPRPPVIFISIDTFASQHMASYGYARQTTPNLDALLKEAVLFERCVANAPWTTPSYLSVLSGLFPRAHFVESVALGGNTLIDQWNLADNRWTLGESMRARGYETAGFVDTLWLDERFRVNQGFDHWDDSAADLQMENPAYGVAYVTEQATRWLRKLEAGRSPFLLLHALDAHGPYLPELPHLGTFQHDLPEVSRRALAGADYQAGGAMPTWMAMTMHHGVSIRTAAEMQALGIPREIDVDPIIARYDEALLKVDAYLGNFFGTLRSQGLWEDALIIVTGDHGEAFRDEYFGHARLYQEVLEVPLIIKFPGGQGAGRRIATGVQLVDLYPTILELVGVADLPKWLNGQSLMPLLTESASAPRELFSEGGHHEAYTLILGNWKLIESYPSRESGTASQLTHPLLPRAVLEENFPGLIDQPLTSALMKSLESQPGYKQRLAAVAKALRSQEPFILLYDLGEDPGELVNLAESHPAKLAELMPKLQRLKQIAVSAQKNAIQGIAMPAFSAEKLAELSSLGYGNSKGE